MKRIFILAGLVTVFTYCGPSGSFDNGKQNIADQKKTSTGTGTGTARGGGGSGGGGGGGGGEAQSAGESFFNLTVKPAFAGCAAGAACHKDGGTAFAGLPFDYLKAKAKLDGADAKSSSFYQKMRGKPSHVGADTCASGGDDASPCREVQEWWAKENGTGAGGGNNTATSTGQNTGTNTGTGTGTVELRGQAFFTANVKPKFDQTCAGCHPNFDYARLRTFLKSANGTADNNTLINKASGIPNHNGGNVCGTKNSSPCAEFQTWFSRDP
jgi:hypothetical protein